MARSSKSVCIVRQGPNDPLLQREYRALQGAGLDVDVIMEKVSGRPWRETIDGVRFYRLPLQRQRAGKVRYVLDYVGFAVLATLLLTALHLRRRYRVVQVTTMPDFLVFAALPAKLLGARVIGFFKEPTPELGGLLTGSAKMERILARVEQLSIRFCDEVLTVTEQLRGVYLGRGADPAKIGVVLNPTEPPERIVDRPERSNGDQFLLFTHGSVEHRYGHETVLRALQLLRKDVPEARLVFCGRGGDLDDVLGLIDELDLHDAVDYLGFVSEDELWEAMGGADVGIVAQLSSTYSNLVHTVKMYEYLHAGLPVVLSRLDSAAAYFDDGCLSFFTPGDHESLCEVLLALHDDREELARRGRCARKLYDVYGWPAQRRAYLAAFDRYVELAPLAERTS
ncbi:MAG: glycosyltransferase [Acidimicrobiales bacterium]|nr:glycosyltransferase [Acidimicrobiales bacterium]